MNRARIVLVTHPPRGARAFGAELVTRRLAACVNLVSIASVYRWEGEVERSREMLLVIKTVQARLSELERHVRRAHPYDTPEFVVLRPARVESRYLAWLGASTRMPRAR
jgi:periplasmic divalent cation tolerance protein